MSRSPSLIRAAIVAATLMCLTLQGNATEPGIRSPLFPDSSVVTAVTAVAPSTQADGVIDVGAITLAANGPCEPSWLPTFQAPPGLAGANVACMTVFDDGSGGGPQLYVAGEFGSAGGTPVHNIARWDGSSWSDVGGGLNGPVYALAVTHGAGGQKLYAGGNFSNAGGTSIFHLACWNGTSWSGLGTGPQSAVFTLLAFDDGGIGGEQLYVGGSFDFAGGVLVHHVARWNGSAWSTLGVGANGNVRCLYAFDDGSGGGPKLCAGGDFTTAGGAPAKAVARWDGASWSALGNGINSGSVSALAAFDDGLGGGIQLYAGGLFQISNGAPGNFMARLNGATWTGVSGGMNNTVQALAVFDDGSGPKLHAGGWFTLAGGLPANRIARWDGTAWSPVESGTDDTVLSFLLFDDGSDRGPVLLTSGMFGAAGTSPAGKIAAWDGAWSSIGTGPRSPTAPNKFVRAFATFDDGTGPALYVGGQFTKVGAATAKSIARWDGTSWSDVGGGTSGSIFALATFDDGSGPKLYAAGSFSNAGGIAANSIACWDGKTWSALGSGITGVNAIVFALTTFDDGLGGGPALYVGGTFVTAGGMSAKGVARWNGSTWSALGSGLVGVNAGCLSLATFDDGGGTKLYVGGQFTTAGGISANRIARWNGTTWSALGSGLNNAVQALQTIDLGSGMELYAGGQFTTPVTGIARWDGAAWSTFGAMNGTVWSLTAFDDGSGPALIAGGKFSTAGGTPANGIARWDGTSWSAFGSGMNDWVRALSTFDDGAGPALYAGGDFTTSPAEDAYLAKLQGCALDVPSDLNGDGAVNAADLALLLGARGQPGATDLNGDGTTDAADVAILLSAWS